MYFTHNKEDFEMRYFIIFATCVFFAMQADTMSNVVTLRAGRNITLDDTTVGQERIELSCGRVFSGTGILDSKEILISCNEFDFAGIIRCDGECNIYVKKDFDHDMFAKEGTGTFTVIVNPHNAEKHTLKTLSLKIDEILFKDPMALTQEAICVYLNDARYHALMNGIDESAIKNDICKKIKQLDKSELTGQSAPSAKTAPSVKIPGYGTLLRNCLLPILGTSAGAGFALFGKNVEVDKPFGYILGTISLVWLCKNIYQFSESKKALLTQQEKLAKEAEAYLEAHREELAAQEKKMAEQLAARTEKLAWIQEIVDNVFAEPYESEIKVFKL